MRMRTWAGGVMGSTCPSPWCEAHDRDLSSAQDGNHHNICVAWWLWCRAFAIAPARPQVALYRTALDRNLAVAGGAIDVRGNASLLLNATSATGNKALGGNGGAIQARSTQFLHVAPDTLCLTLMVRAFLACHNACYLSAQDWVVEAHV